MMATTEGTTEVTEASVAWNQEASDNTSTEANSTDFKERYAEVIGKVNSALEGVDWTQMGRIGKSLGILVAVIVAQILIKGVLDTINLLPLVPMKRHKMSIQHKNTLAVKMARTREGELHLGPREKQSPLTLGLP